MMPTEIDMPNPEDTGSPAATSRPPLRTWDFMETLFVSLIAYGVYTLTAGLALTLMPAMPDWTTTLSSVQFQVLGAAHIVASPLTIAVLWIAVQMAGRDFVEYLALNWPSPGELLRALAIMAMILFAESLAGYAIGEKQTVMNSFAGARAKRRISSPPHRRLCRGADHGRVRCSWFHVARMVAVLPWTGRSDRADIGIVGNDPYPV